MKSLSLNCIGVDVVIRSNDGPILELLRQNFSAMEGPVASAELHYEIEIQPDRGVIEIRRRGAEVGLTARDQGELILMLEGDLVVQLQLQRPQYLCVHAAVPELDGGAHLLIGRSGAGKSTTCWGLLHHGFGYMSDELAPIDLDGALVQAYAHALCMKREPPPDYPLPSGTLATSRGYHLATGHLPSPVTTAPLPLRSMIFVNYDGDLAHSAIAPIGQAEATARLYPNILNALAHPDAGLEVAARLTRNLPRYKLESARLDESCELIADTLAKSQAPR